MFITKKLDGLYLSVQTNAGLSTTVNLSKIFSSTSPIGRIVLTWAEEQILHQLRAQLTPKKNEVEEILPLLSEVSAVLGMYADTLCNCHRCKDLAVLKTRLDKEINKHTKPWMRPCKSCGR